MTVALQREATQFGSAKNPCRRGCSWHQQGQELHWQFQHIPTCFVTDSYRWTRNKGLVTRSNPIEPYNEWTNHCFEQRVMGATALLRAEYGKVKWYQVIFQLKSREILISQLIPILGVTGRGYSRDSGCGESPQNSARKGMKTSVDISIHWCVMLCFRKF